MFVYQKKLQYPVRIKNTNPKLASLIISQYGGPECQRGGRESVPEFVKKTSSLVHMFTFDQVMLRWVTRIMCG